MMTRHRASSPSRIYRRAAVLAAVCLIATGTGCGEKAPPAATADAIDACTLLTRADVDAVLGITVGDPQARQNGTGEFWLSTCNYSAETTHGILAASLLLKPHHVADGPMKAYSDYESGLIAELGKDVALTPVDGIGERAGWQDFGTPIGQLAVFRGPYQLILTASATAGADQLTNAKTLAGTVLQRLQAQE